MGRGGRGGGTCAVESEVVPSVSVHLRREGRGGGRGWGEGWHWHAALFRCCDARSEGSCSGLHQLQMLQASDCRMGAEEEVGCDVRPGGGVALVVETSVAGGVGEGEYGAW